MGKFSLPEDIEPMEIIDRLKGTIEQCQKRYREQMRGEIHPDGNREAFSAFLEHVSGKVYLKLYKGNVIIQGRESEESLYDQDIASMDIHGGYDQKDAMGFIRLNALRLKASARRLKKTGRGY